MTTNTVKHTPPMTPTEKHRETAKDIAFDFDCDWTADGREIEVA